MVILGLTVSIPPWWCLHWNVVKYFYIFTGVVRCLPEFVHILLSKGFTASFCQSDYYRDARLSLWYMLFVWSKAIELVDTLFIIVRGGKLITLHWIHHCLTLCYSWYVFADVPATARWMVNMNFLVHSLMYTYYALKAVRVPIPGLISISITSLQILQMVFGLYINYTVIGFKKSGIACDCSLSVATTGLALYTLFLILFVNYFIRAYLVKPMLNPNIDINRNGQKQNGNVVKNNNCVFAD